MPRTARYSPRLARAPSGCYCRLRRSKPGVFEGAAAVGAEDADRVCVVQREDCAGVGTEHVPIVGDGSDVAEGGEDAVAEHQGALAAAEGLPRGGAKGVGIAVAERHHAPTAGARLRRRKNGSVRRPGRLRSRRPAHRRRFDCRGTRRRSRTTAACRRIGRPGVPPRPMAACCPTRCAMWRLKIHTAARRGARRGAVGDFPGARGSRFHRNRDTGGHRRPFRAPERSGAEGRVRREPWLVGAGWVERKQA